MSAVHVRMVDVSGDTPGEVAEVIANMLDGQKRESVERVQRVMLDTLAGQRQSARESEPEIEVPAVAELAEPPSIPGDIDFPDGTFATWLDIPEAQRAWNAIGDICHVVLDLNEPTTPVCGHELGVLRDPRRDPMNNARVCAACNRAIERARRNQ